MTSKLLFLGLLLVSNGAWWLAPSIAGQAIGVMGLILLPGIIWAKQWCPDFLSQTVIGGGISYGLVMLLSLGGYYAGLFNDQAWLMALLLNSISLSGLMFQPPNRSSQLSPIIGALFIVMIVGAMFRLSGLGYSEFQGDETDVLFPVADALTGYDQALFTDRRKGPGELLLPMMLWSLTGRLTEFTARLPFALAGILIIPTTYLVGCHLVEPRVGLVAALLVALNGMLIAFSRIVQYQSLVLWFCLLAVLTSYLAQSTRPQALFRGLTGLFVGFGLLTHYDAVLIVPVILYLIVIYRKNSWYSTLFAWRFALLILLLILMPFYLPYLLSPQIDSTQTYLGQRIGQPLAQSQLENFFRFAIFYTSLYYFSLTGGLILGFLAWRIYQWPATTQAQKLLLIWLSLTFITYNFLIADPRTHIYTIFPAWCFVTAMMAVTLWDWFKPMGQALFLGGGIIWLSLVSGYLYLLYLRQEVEFLTLNPAEMPLVYRYVDYLEQPADSFFGLVHRAGWKMAGGLLATGQLPPGDYSTNEKPEVATWYTRHQARGCEYQTPLYFRVAYPRIDPTILEANYTLLKQMPAGLGLYSQQPYSLKEADSETLISVFDDSATPNVFARPQFIYQPTQAILGHPDFGVIVELQAYALTQTKDNLTLKLYWQPRQPIPVDLTVFVHLIDPQTEAVISQSDHRPACGQSPTYTWTPGQFVVDSHTLRLKTLTPNKSYQLITGLYLPNQNSRLILMNPDAPPDQNFILLQTIGW